MKDIPLIMFNNCIFSFSFPKVVSTNRNRELMQPEKIPTATLNRASEAPKNMSTKEKN